MQNWLRREIEMVKVEQKKDPKKMQNDQRGMLNHACERHKKETIYTISKCSFSVRIVYLTCSVQLEHIVNCNICTANKQPVQLCKSHPMPDFFIYFFL